MFKYFLKREIKEKYLGNISGISWLFIQPLLILLIYGVVFEKIFKARIPEAENIGFIVYLAIGFWPWIAFSESLVQSISSLTEKKDLIGKINFNSIEIVLASVTATFLLNILGYLVVLLALILVGKQFLIANLALLVIPLLYLYLLSVSLSIVLSAIHVYIRDVQNIFATLITLLFFSTPIIYSKSLIPEQYQSYMEWNPLYFPITFIHDALLTGNELPWKEMGMLFGGTIVFLILCIKIYKRLETRFEDFI